MRAIRLLAATPLGMAAVAVAQPPLTVSDIVGMTTIGSRVQGYGDEDYDVVSPDGAHVAVVVKRGDVERNTIDYALMVFKSTDLMRHPAPDTVVALACGSNRPGIVHVRWLSDNATLVFLGERSGELPQVYTVDTRSHALAQRTHATTPITNFDISASGNVVVYAAEHTSDTSRYASMRARGFVLGRRELVSDVIAGKWGGGLPSWDAVAPRLLHVVRAGHDADEATIQIPDSAAGYTRCELRSLSVAPTGDAALVRCTPRVPPPEWVSYKQKEYHEYASMGFTFPVDVVIPLSGDAPHRLFNAPAQLEQEALWAPDGRSVVLANAILPLDRRDSARAVRQMLAEVEVGTGAVTIVARRDSLTALAWDPSTATVELMPGAYLKPTETSRLYYRKGAQGWAELPAGKRLGAHVPPLVIEQTMNLPPRLVVVDAATQSRRVVYEPNPGFLQAHRLAHEEVIHFKTKAGAAWVSGLYRPVDATAGVRHPLLIQTHGFDSTAFWPDGIYATGEAAQPLAGAGFVVLQMAEPPGDQWVTPREGAAHAGRHRSRHPIPRQSRYYRPDESGDSGLQPHLLLHAVLPDPLALSGSGGHDHRWRRRQLRAASHLHARQP